MNTKYTIKNFRVFDEEGATFDLKPITILTGANSSGKSSIVKSINLLIDYINNFVTSNKDEVINFDKEIIDFTKKENSILGNFLSILHKDSSSDCITFAYTTHSNLLFDDVKVEYVFKTEPKDKLKNAYLHSYSIIDKNENIIYYYGKDGKKWNFNLILNNFYIFSIASYVIQTVESIYLGGKAEKNKINKAFEYAKTFIESNGIDIWNDIAWGSKKYNIFKDIDKKTQITNIIANSSNNGILFYLNILDILKNEPKGNVRNILFDSLNKQDIIPQYILYGLEKMLLDFEQSSFSSFVQYYKKLETDFLCETTEKKDFINIGPFSFENLYPNLTSSGEIFVDSLSGLELKEGKIEIIDNDRSEHNLEEVKKAPVNFGFVYTILTKILYYSNKWDTENLNVAHFGDNIILYHFLGEIFSNWFRYICKEVVIDNIPSKVLFDESSSLIIKKLYSLETDDKVTNILKQYFAVSNKRFDRTKTIDDFLNYWLREFEIGDRITIESAPDGLGVTIRLYQDKEDIKGTILAFDGYGISQLVMILLRLGIAIARRSYTGFHYNTLDGMIQQRYKSNKKWRSDIFDIMTLSFSEPEIHLHPKFQSKLADLFVEVYMKYKINVIVETHSEYLIRKLQLLVADKKKAITGNDISIIYLDNPNPAKREQGDPQIRNIYIDEDGDLSEGFAPGFYDVADELSMSLLKITSNDKLNN